jgi:hypothetical protein
LRKALNQEKEKRDHPREHRDRQRRESTTLLLCLSSVSCLVLCLSLCPR